MEPQIQYAKTSDGVNIAYWMMGKGLPIVVVTTPPWSNISEEWNLPANRDVYEWVLRGASLVRYDHRGCGLSDRDAGPLSLAAYVKDLEAVTERLDLTSFALIGVANGAPIAAAYAAEHAGRLSHLILSPIYARAADAYATPAGQALRALRDKDWTIYTESMARIVAGFSGGEELLSRMATYYRSCVSQEGSLAAHQAIEGFDLSDDLPRIRVPTLVMMTADSSVPAPEIVRAATAAIPGARLVIYKGPTGAWTQEQRMLAAQFLGLEQQVAGMPPPTPSGTAIILFADIADSTALTERLGDAAFREKARELDAALRKAIASSGGTAIDGKLLGDGVLATFGAAREAIEAAVRCADAGTHLGLPLHVGIHAGDVIRESNNVFGGAVNIAARISNAAAPGEVLVSDVVRSLARTSAGVSFEDRGERALKGIEEPVRAWAVVASR